MRQTTFTSALRHYNITEAVANLKLRSFLNREFLKNRKIKDFLDYTLVEYIEYFENRSNKNNQSLQMLYQSCLDFLENPVLPPVVTPSLITPPSDILSVQPANVIEHTTFPLKDWEGESLWFQLTHTVDSILNLLVEKGAKRVHVKAKRAIQYFQANKSIDEIADSEHKTREAIHTSIKDDIIDKILAGAMDQDCLVNFSLSTDFLRQLEEVRIKYLLQDTSTIEAAIGCPQGVLAKSNYKIFFEGEEISFISLNNKTVLSPQRIHPLYQIIVSLDKQLSKAFAFEGVSDLWKGIKQEYPKIPELKEYSDFIYHWLSTNPQVETDELGGYRLKTSALKIGYVRQARIIYDSPTPLSISEIGAIHRELFGEMNLLLGHSLHDLGFVCTNYRWHHPQSPNSVASQSSSTAA